MESLKTQEMSNSGSFLCMFGLPGKVLRCWKSEVPYWPIFTLNDLIVFGRRSGCICLQTEIRKERQGLKFPLFLEDFCSIVTEDMWLARSQCSFVPWRFDTPAVGRVRSKWPAIRRLLRGILPISPNTFQDVKGKRCIDEGWQEK